MLLTYNRIGNASVAGRAINMILESPIRSTRKKKSPPPPFLALVSSVLCSRVL